MNLGKRFIWDPQYIKLEFDLLKMWQRRIVCEHFSYSRSGKFYWKKIWYFFFDKSTGSGVLESKPRNQSLYLDRIRRIGKELVENFYRVYFNNRNGYLHTSLQFWINIDFRNWAISKSKFITGTENFYRVRIFQINCFCLLKYSSEIILSRPVFGKLYKQIHYCYWKFYRVNFNNSNGILHTDFIILNIIAFMVITSDLFQFFIL